jgi:FMN phosphatase YigB (HAD superfamily)
MSGSPLTQANTPEEPTSQDRDVGRPGLGHDGIKTIFWDLGGVILTNGWDVGQRTRVLTRLGVDLAEYEARHDAANFYWERGLATAREFFDETVFYRPRAFTFEELWPMVCAESAVIHPECIEIVDHLNSSGRLSSSGRLASSGRVKVATLNNESRELNEYRLDAFDLRRRFGFFICSGYVHEMKPMKDIYRSAIEISGYAAEQALFIDDKQENCDAAARLGMKAIRFETPVQLRGALRDFGIDV